MLETSPTRLTGEIDDDAVTSTTAPARFAPARGAGDVDLAGRRPMLCPAGCTP